MAYNKLTGSQAILGGAVILNTPTVYGTPVVENATTDATLGGIKLGGATLYIKQIPFTGVSLSATTSLTDTGWDIPYGAVVEDAWIDVITKATSGTVSVGVGGSTANLIAATACTTDAAAYAFQPVLDVDSVFINATTTLRVRVPYSVSKATTARSVTITRSTTEFTSAFSANLYIKYIVPE